MVQVAKPSSALVGGLIVAVALGLLWRNRRIKKAKVAPLEKPNELSQRPTKVAKSKIASAVEGKNHHRCDICGIQCRGAASYRDHLNGKSHQRNAALADGRISETAVRANKNHASAAGRQHCKLCEAWMPASEFDEHLQSRTHLLAVKTHEAGTGSRVFFDNSAALEDGAGSSVGIVTCDLEQATNAGAICRALCNFAPVGSRLTLVHSEPGSTTSSLLVSGKMRTVARRCDQKLRRQKLSLDDFLHALPLWERPLVVVETAQDAENIYSFSFPPACDILVGGESRGVHPRILEALRPGVDRIVFVPMAGCHFSMNVSACLTVALYEYRRQHPCGGG